MPNFTANAFSNGVYIAAPTADEAGRLISDGAGQFSFLKHNLSASSAPTSTDDSDSGYGVGSPWVDTAADKAYVCLDPTPNSAVWTETTGSASSPLTLTSGGASEIPLTITADASQTAKLTEWEDSSNTAKLGVLPSADGIVGEDGSGTDAAGGNTIVAGGRGTGSGDGGAFVVQTAASGGTGSSLNSLTDRMKVDTDGNFGIGPNDPTTPDGSNTIGDTWSLINSIFGSNPVLALVGDASTSGNYAGVVFGRLGGSSNPRRAGIRYVQASDKLQLFGGGQLTSAPGAAIDIDSGQRVGIKKSLNTLSALLHIAAGTASDPAIKFDSGTKLTTPEAGALEYDGGTLMFTPSANRFGLRGAEGVVISDTTVSDTVTETEIYSNPVSANELFKGSKWELNFAGVYSTDNATDTFTLRLKIGGTTVESITSTAANVTDAAFHVRFFFTTRSTGSSGTVSTAAFGEFADEAKSSVSTGTTTINTTTSEDITVTLQWDNALAGDSLTLQQGHTELYGKVQS